ncbi:MAG: Uncharacterised protein [SAR116 cluster bacterium]|nr:MAG: Uncharacterised protein [SAR116 cluster bacterium]
MKKFILLLISLLWLSCASSDQENNVLRYSLIISADLGGSVSKTGGEFQAGETITVTAVPDEGFAFLAWSDGYSSPSRTIVVFESQNLVATFVENPYFFNKLSLNAPPYQGTIWETGDIINASDPSAFNDISYSGIGERQMYDRRNGGAWVNLSPFLFDVSFSDGLSTEIQVNPEFSLEQATEEANKYAFLIGQLPKGLRKDVFTIWIHKGEENYGGGNNNILIHTGMTEVYENYSSGIVEETLIHEAVHTSVDAYLYPNRETDGVGWVNAAQKDGCYISSYAMENPFREDIAELFPFYVAIKYFPERISEQMRDNILSCNLNRILYLDTLDIDLNMYQR